VLTQSLHRPRCIDQVTRPRGGAVSTLIRFQWHSSCGIKVGRITNPRRCRRHKPPNASPAVRWILRALLEAAALGLRTRRRVHVRALREWQTSRSGQRRAKPLYSQPVLSPAPMRQLQSRPLKQLPPPFERAGRHDKQSNTAMAAMHMALLRRNRSMLRANVRFCNLPQQHWGRREKALCCHT
jgi:hypothetical protein